MLYFCSPGNANGGGGGGSGASAAMSPSPMLSGRVTPSSGERGGGAFGFGSPSASANPSAPMSARSNSAIDPSAVRRASVRAQYAARNRVAVGGTLSEFLSLLGLACQLR